MEKSILNTINRFSLLQEGDTVTVALSGGADSVALLYALYILRDDLNITVNAAHLNHSIRGQEAERDAEFVKEFCEKLNIELFYESKDVPKYAKQNKISLELAAREVRYDFLQKVAVGKIATAHTASDNLETMIFNLTRGSSLKGLCGIPVKRGNIIRPLINCTRKDIEDYCEQNGLSFVTDSTNLTDDYARNKIRHKVIPVLKEINSTVEQNAFRTSELLYQDNAYLEYITEEILYKNYDDSLNISDFENISPAIAKRIIKKYFEIDYPSVLLDNRHINDIYSICLNGSGKINLPSNLFAIVNKGNLLFTDLSENSKEFAVKVNEIQNVNNLFSNNAIDCDKIVGKWILRTRNEGDKIRLQNRGITKSLKKLFTENKVPETLRNSIPVIADNEGVIWVHGFGVAQRVSPSKNTKKILDVEVQEI